MTNTVQTPDSAHGTAGLFRSRQHPIKILGYTTRSFWLILIPLTRDLVASRYDIASWLYGSWLSILTISVIFLYAFFRWYLITYRIDDDCIVCRSGMFGLFETKLYFCTVTSVSSAQSIINRLFRASRVYLCCSGKGSRAALRLTMKRSDMVRLFSLLGLDENRQGGPLFCFKPKRSHLVIFSLLFSSSLSGLILIATFLLQSGKLIGARLERDIKLGLIELSDNAKTLADNLSEISVAAVVCFFSLFSISFIANLIRHASFTVTRKNGRLFITSGLVTRRFHILKSRAIIYSDAQQNLLMKLFGICSVRIFCAGYGIKNRELNVLVPITTLGRVRSSLRLLFPQHLSVSPSVRAIRRNFFSYVWLPLSAETIILLSGTLLVSLSLFVEGAVRLLVIFSQIPVIWLFAAKLVSLFKTAIGYKDGMLRLDVCRLYRFHRVTIHASNISCVTIKQSPFQRGKNRCNLRLYAKAPSRRSFLVKNIPLDETLRLLSEAGVFCQQR